MFVYTSITFCAFKTENIIQPRTLFQWVVIWRHLVAKWRWCNLIKHIFDPPCLPYPLLPPASSWTNTRGFPLTPGRNNNNMASHGLAYDGCNFFRQRLVLSTLSGKRVKIKNIRSKDDDPGLRGESQLHSAACGVAVSSAANELAVTQLGVCFTTGRRRCGKWWDCSANAT